jgi:hypothetical protein
MKERMLDGSDKEVSEGRMPSQVRQAIEFGTSNGCRVELFESKHFLGMTDVIIDKFGGNNSNHLVECIRMTDNGDETFSVDNAYIAVNKDFIPIDGVPYEREAYVDEFANQAEFFENLGNSAAEAMHNFDVSDIYEKINDCNDYIKFLEDKNSAISKHIIELEAEISDAKEKESACAVNDEAYKNEERKISSLEYDIKDAESLIAKNESDIKETEKEKLDAEAKLEKMRGKDKNAAEKSNDKDEK